MPLDMTPSTATYFPLSKLLFSWITGYGADIYAPN